MEYYESNRPAVDDSGLSGGVSFNYNGQIAVQQMSIGMAGGGGGGGVDGGSKPSIYTLAICVNGSPKSLRVYVAGQPY